MTFIALALTLLVIALFILLTWQTIRLAKSQDALEEARDEKQRMYGRELDLIKDHGKLRLALKEAEYELDQAKTENARVYGREMSLLEVRFALARVKFLADLAYQVGVTQELNWLIRDNELNPVKELTSA